MARFIGAPSQAGSRPGPGRHAVWMAASDSSQKKKPRKGGEGDEAEGQEEGGQKLAKKGEELKEDMDSLMDEIDSVLEENAEEFVKNYVQRGGE